MVDVRSFIANYFKTWITVAANYMSHMSMILDENRAHK
jgi:hypothetical protein